MLNQGYAFTTIIGNKDHGQTVLSHLASLYPHSSLQAWQQNLNNREVTINGVTATGSESLISGQTLIWNRPPWIEPDTPQHFEVLFGLLVALLDHRTEQSGYNAGHMGELASREFPEKLKQFWWDVRHASSVDVDPVEIHLQFGCDEHSPS